jgi:predicted outer membrane protein
MAKTDHCLAQMVAWGNEGEIALGELAQQQSQNASVKEFAKTLVDDHSKFLKELQAAVPGITHTGDHQQRATNERTRQGEAQDRREAAEQVDANSPNRRDGQPNQPRSNENPPARNEGAEAQSAQAGDQQMLQIQEQVARKCLASTEKEFRNLDQDKFDHAYLGQQCMAHMKMIAELEVFQQHASPELAELFRQGVETAREHLQQAKKLKEQLDGRGVASRPTERTTE